MTDPAHSPHPFTLVKGCAGSHGHLILDAFSDSIAALAVKTGDHPPEEQLANAMLFVHSPHMLQALKAVHCREAGQLGTPTRIPRRERPGGASRLASRRAEGRA